MYLLLKLFHIVFVVAFLGNITTGLFWHAHAARTHDPRILAHTVAGIIRSDRLFTTPGVLGIIVTGVSAAVIAGMPILKTGWILWTLVAFGISGLVFGTRVAPLQRQLLAQASAGADTGNFDYPAYRALAEALGKLGLAALLTPMIGLGLMVLKPVL